MTRGYSEEDQKNPYYVDFAEDIVVDVYSKNFEERYCVPARVLRSRNGGIFGRMWKVQSRGSFFSKETGSMKDETLDVNYQGCTSMGLKAVYNAKNAPYPIRMPNV